ncbi:MAG TPA: Crp/Fnr family transcriptional regulator [Blastocatellia bacterium]|nr:Crp/Fnr family transcriptional regulator [Blastocatellia bacterium]
MSKIEGVIEMSDLCSNASQPSMSGPVAHVTGGENSDFDMAEAGPLRAKIGYLSAMDLFRDLTPEEMEEVERATVMQTYRAGRVFYTPGDTGEVLFILKQGVVQLYRMSAEGRKLVIARLEPVCFFGEMSCVGQGMYNTFAEATEDSLIYTMSCHDVGRLLLAKPEVAVRILEAVGQRLVNAERQLEEMAFKGLIPRVAALLLRAAEGDEVKGLSHQDLAERLGVYRETVTNALNELKTANILNVGRKHINIVDRKRLERAASE